MAEKYGTVPKRFTKAWWEYFWMYYKWHTIIIAFIIIAVSTTVYQKMTEPKYDITVTYAGEKFASDEAVDKFIPKLSEMTDDVNNDKKSLANFAQLNFSNDQKDPQYTMSMQMKLQLAISEDETFLYIFDENIVRQYCGEDSGSSAFAPLSDWLTAKVDEEDILTVNSVPVAVKVSDNKLFKKYNIPTDGMYLAIRYYPRKDQKKSIPGYKASVKLANKILLQQ